MILRTTTPRDAETEKKVLDWFIENFGEADTAELVAWVWCREPTAERYLAAICHIGQETAKHGKQFVQNLIDHSRRSRGPREAEEQLFATMQPFVEKARVAILGHRGDPLVAEEMMRELRVRLRESLRRMYPDKHRATIDGAIMAGSQVSGAGAVLDFRKIVEALHLPDALATTAASSHGVTDDR